MDNSELLRLIITLSTSNRDFDENLLNIVKYVIWSQKKIYTDYKEIKTDIHLLLNLNFTEHEIATAVTRGLRKKVIERTLEGHFVLNAKQIEFLEAQDENVFQKILINFSKKYNIKKYTVVEIDKLITTYLFKYINENTNSLLTMLQKSDKIQNIHVASFNEEYTNEEKEFINQFIDWDNKEKNEILYKLISFSVDYCKLTVKKGNNAFKSLLKGKEFFLDANIIYRLMGINNAERQEVIHEFINACQEAGIKIKYTNFTKNEVLVSLKHNVAKMMSEVGRLRISPDKLKRDGDIELDLYTIFYKLSKDAHKWLTVDDLSLYLENLFRRCVKDFEYVEYDNPKMLDNLFEQNCEKLCEYKPNVPIESIEVDVQNFMAIRNTRKKHMNGNAWQIKQFIISADRKYVSWAGELMHGMTPLVVLPSAWYSLILKIQGRSSNDYESFSQFLKLRLKADKTDEVVRKALYAIAQVSSEQEIQEKVFDTLMTTNNFISKSKDVDYDEMDEFTVNEVNSAKDMVHEQYKIAGFEEGKLSGEQIGLKKGYDEGFNLGKLQEQQTIIEKLAQEATDKHFKRMHVIDNIFSIAFILAIVAVIIGIVVIFLKLINNNNAIDFINKISTVTAFLETSISLLISMVVKTIKHIIKKNCKTKEEYLEEKKEYFKQKISVERNL